ncbi:MAG TPA: o-succinylbenzoate synthase [Actinomycetota bacterium]|nr:o-succinylbenzoate synthase [Actinomycetota bacterium]
MTRVESIELSLIALPLVRPFRVSFGTSTGKECVLARVRLNGVEGWGECVADDGFPGFSGEWNEGVWALLRDVLGPALLAADDVSADTVEDRLRFVRGNPMAKATLINAVLDAQLRTTERSLVSWLGADRRAVPCGVSIGIAHTTDELRARVDEHLEQGYLRIKLKIMPGIDVERVAAIRCDHPDILLSVDANAAYRPEDVETFRALDDFDLLMVEQPLHYEDLVRHAALQAAIRTPICLDESIRSAADAAAAIELGACRIINIKQGRVGGVLEARRVHDVAAAAGVPVWCGGMLETGIGRATNLALAALPNFTLPGDTSASARYFADDLTEPFVLEDDGTMRVPDGPGIGVEPRSARLGACTVRSEIVTTS